MNELLTGQIVSLGAMNENGFPITGAFVEISRDEIKATTGNYLYSQVALVPVAMLKEMEWQPIETAPKDGTKFLAFMRESWMEIMYYDNGDLFYGSDGDSPPAGRSLPTHWRAITGPM